MNAFDGLSIPTFFVNKIIATRIIGPHVQVYYGVCPDDSEALPDLSMIWLRQDWTAATENVRRRLLCDPPPLRIVP